MPRVQSAADSRTNLQHDDGWTPLDDPRVRYLAAACIRRGQPAVEVAQALGMDAATLCALLGVEVDA